MPKKAPENLKNFESLVEIMKALREPGGCPWDRKQDHKTLAPYALEEAYELANAIEKGDQANLVEELGDLLLQIVFHAEVGRENGSFTLADVIEGINTKLIYRHPHVFADVDATTPEQVLENWGELKAKEKEGKPKSDGPFDIPLNFPSLMRSQKIGKKTKDFNFDWNSVNDVIAKVEEELEELKSSLKTTDKAAQEAELGDLLFSVAQLSRHMKLEAEQTLRLANIKFENRFEKMQKLAKSQNLDFDSLSSPELEKLWEEVKRQSK